MACANAKGNGTRGRRNRRRRAFFTVGFGQRGKAGFVWADHASWNRRTFRLAGGFLRGLVVELCRLLEGLGNVGPSRE
jgi:hypothetical protein